MVVLLQLTNVVLHITDVEGGGRHGHPQALFLLGQDGLVEAVLLQVVHGQLTATQLGHHVVRTARERQPPGSRLLAADSTSNESIEVIFSLTHVQRQCHSAT